MPGGGPAPPRAPWLLSPGLQRGRNFLGSALGPVWQVAFLFRGFWRRGECWPGEGSVQGAQGSGGPGEPGGGRLLSASPLLACITLGKPNPVPSPGKHGCRPAAGPWGGGGDTHPGSQSQGGRASGLQQSPSA